MAETKPTPSKLEGIVLDAAVFEDRTNGLTWRQIATKHGYKSHAPLIVRYKRHLSTVVLPHADELRIEELARLEHRERRFRAAENLAVNSGQVKEWIAALKGGLDLQKVRISLLGLDAPQQHQHSLSTGQATVELDDLLGVYLQGAAEGVDHADK